MQVGLIYLPMLKQVRQKGSTMNIIILYNQKINIHSLSLVQPCRYFVTNTGLREISDGHARASQCISSIDDAAY